MIHYILPVIGAFVMSTICGFIFIPVLLNFCKEKKSATLFLYVILLILEALSLRRLVGTTTVQLLS